ncbi:MAG TPA: hypothetical protein P5160_02465 [Candidatus Omnitrophota bacterium]|nr:hypothetical protein [Candidatus Omnitrophota bacterium]
MKKLLLTICLLLLTRTAAAQTILLSEYTVSPQAKYQRLMLVPRAELDGGLGSSCSEDGTLYVNKDDQSLPHFCLNGSWGFLSGIWQQTGDIISLWDTSSPITKMVGIGTASPSLKLTLDVDGGIFSQGTYDPASLSLANLPNLNPGLYFIWYPKKAALWAGEFNAGSFASGLLDSHIGNFSVSFGSNNLASGSGSGVLGGNRNRVLSGADYSVIVSGQNNTINANSDYNIISAGHDNQITGNHNFIGGCENCDLIGDFITVLSGSSNDIDGRSSNSFIGSGYNNVIHGFNQTKGADTHNVIATGQGNSIYGGLNTITGGINNSIGRSTDTSATLYSFIGSGGSNQVVQSPYSMIGSGSENFCLTIASHQTIINGSLNQSSGQFATIGGGQQNVLANGLQNIIAGGSNNSIGAGSQRSFVSGHTNTISGTLHSSGIIGGMNNTINSYYDFIAGSNNVVIGANDQHNSVITGQDITVDRSNNFIMGTNINLSSSYAFIWGHYSEPENISSASNHFIIGTGNVGIGTLDPSERLHIVGDMKISDGSLSISVPVLDATGPQLKREGSTGMIGLDLAERFLSQGEVDPGDILIIAEDGRVLKSSRAYDQRVIGIVSRAPGALLEGTQMQFSPGGITFTGGDNPPVALAGRVHIKVSLENGPIEAGDLLASSSLPGHAMRAEDPESASHAVVAKALERFTGGPEGQETGMIQAIVTLR